jgi:hypothetical protein
MTEQLGKGFPVLTCTYSTEGQLFKHRQLMTAQLGKGFPVLTCKYSTEGQLFKHRQAMKAKLGKGFPVLTSKYSTEGTAGIQRQERTAQLGKGFPLLTGKKQHRKHAFCAVFFHMAFNAQTGKERSILSEMLLRCQANPETGTPTYTHKGKDSTAWQRFSYIDRQIPYLT